MTRGHQDASAGKRDRHDNRIDVEAGALRRIAGCEPPFGSGQLVIDPASIRTTAELKLGFDYKVSNVWYEISGEWDLTEAPFAELDFNRALETVLNGGEWQSTSYYQRVVTEIRAGRPKWGCTTVTQFDNRLRFVVDQMRTEVASLGYIANNNRDQIAVLIGRDGDFIFYDARHRLSMAQQFRIDSVPVTVVGRHSQWVDFARQVVAEVARAGAMQTPITHPDLAHLPSVYGARRFELIRATRPTDDTTVIDLAPGWGYFCESFENDGTAVIAMANNALDRYFLERFRRASQRSFPITRSASETVDLLGSTQCDLLALGDTLKRIRRLRDAHGLCSLIVSLHPRSIYVETSGAPTAQTRHEDDPSGDPVVSYIRTHTSLRHVTRLGVSERGRLLLRLRHA